MKDERSAFAAYRLLTTAGVGPAKLRAILKHAEYSRTDLAVLIDDSIALQTLLSDAQIQDLRVGLKDATETWTTLIGKGITPLFLADLRYPDSLRSVLGSNAPVLLFVQGNLSLLSIPSLGFCGSRAASEKGIRVARECAEAASKKGINIVSGYAAGIDEATHKAALVAGGTTAAILAEGIMHFRIKRDLKEFWDWERAVVVSQYLPRVTWNVGNAMKRNGTICALSHAMVLIEARETGGSIEAGRACLNLGIPLFAPVYDGMPDSAKGNQILLAQGARSFYKRRSSNLPNLDGVLSAIQKPALKAASSY